MVQGSLDEIPDLTVGFGPLPVSHAGVKENLHRRAPYSKTTGFSPQCHQEATIVFEQRLSSNEKAE